MLTPMEQQLVKVGYCRGNFDNWYASAYNVPCPPRNFGLLDVLVRDERIVVVQAADGTLYRTLSVPVVAVFDNVADFMRYCGDNRPAPQGINVWD